MLLRHLATCNDIWTRSGRAFVTIFRRVFEMGQRHILTLRVTVTIFRRVRDAFFRRVFWMRVCCFFHSSSRITAVVLRRRIRRLLTCLEFKLLRLASVLLLFSTIMPNGMQFTNRVVSQLFTGFYTETTKNMCMLTCLSRFCWKNIKHNLCFNGKCNDHGFCFLYDET